MAVRKSYGSLDRPRLLYGKKAIFTSTMAAQTSVQIQPSTLDVAATGVHLVSLKDIGHTKTVEAILGEDREVLAPLLPYAVLVINGSSRKLRACGIRFQ
jgi:hypothetical protein